MTSLLPLLHLHDLVPVEAAHLQLPVEVPHRERHEVLVRDAALQGDTLVMKVKIIPCEGSSCSQYLDLGGPHLQKIIVGTRYKTNANL